MAKKGKIVIIEDDNIFANKFKSKLQKEYFQNEEIDIINFFDWNYIIKYKIDLLFVDIELSGGVNGIEEAEKIRRMKYWDIEIIFVTNRSNLISDSFLANPIAFITKQELESGLERAVMLLKRKGFRDKKYIDINNTIIEINNIMYIESNNHEAIFHMRFDEEIGIRIKLEEIEKELEVMNCIRIHKSFIVNMRFIKKRYYNKVTLLNDYDLPVGRIYADEFKKIYIKAKLEQII